MTRLTVSFVTATALVALLGSSPTAHAGGKPVKRVFQSADMISLQSGQPEGAATLIRKRNRIEGRVMVNVETAGDPYTVWWVVFNRPEKCRYTPCTVIPPEEGGGVYVEDLLNPETGVAIFSAGGAISAANGRPEGADSRGVINLDIKTLAGRKPEGLFVLETFFDGTPFPLDRLLWGNGLRAEIHLIVDRHPELVSWSEDLTTTNWSPNFNHRAAIFTSVETRWGWGYR
ncbi:MAG: hypothetical protein AAF648_15535 [Pseudomonadota bacterium]